LRAEGHVASRGRVERLMRHHGIRARKRRFRVRTMDSHYDLPAAPNLLEQTFVATRPKQVWLADITYVPTAEGWLNLAVVLDLFTRKIVGWSMRDHLRADLAIAALSMAIQRQRPAPGPIHHFDRGSQYFAADYRKALTESGLVQSMSRKGNCSDNAAMESYFGTMKTELVHQVRQYAMLPSATCSPPSKDTTIVSGSIPRVYHPRTGRAPSRLIRCPLNRSKVSLAFDPSRG
jgi:putative transposase